MPSTTQTLRCRSSILQLGSFVLSTYPISVLTVSSILDCGSAIGIANHADFWDTLRAPNVHVHRSSITAVSDTPAHATIHLSNGSQIQSIDLAVHATGWKPVVPVRFEPAGLGVSLGLPCQIPSRSNEKGTSELHYWGSLDTAAELKLRATHKKSITPSMSNPTDRETSPYRLYRRMVSPALVEEGDRSFAVMGIVLSSTIAVIAEVQALWVAAFLTGGLDNTTPDDARPENKQSLYINTLSRENLDREVSEDVVWGNITGGGLAVDSIHVRGNTSVDSCDSCHADANTVQRHAHARSRAESPSDGRWFLVGNERSLWAISIRGNCRRMAGHAGESGRVKCTQYAAVNSMPEVDLQAHKKS